MRLLFSLAIPPLSFRAQRLAETVRAVAGRRRTARVTVRSGPGRRSLPRSLRCACVLILSSAPLTSAPAAEDTYLQLLDQEATKVEPNSTDTNADQTLAAAQDDSMAAARPAPSRALFEALLKRQHLGTYSFYDRLPERSREEIFLDYSSGASMEALREKIIDRYLHP